MQHARVFALCQQLLVYCLIYLLIGSTNFCSRITFCKQRTFAILALQMLSAQLIFASSSIIYFGRHSACGKFGAVQRSEV